MSARLTRQEMKTDEVQESLLRIIEYVRENLTKILLAIGAILVAGALVIGFRQMAEARELKAQAALGEALEAYRVPVDAESPEGVTTDEIRRSRAKAAFEGVRSQHGGSRAAEIAGVYLGLLAVEAGDLEAGKDAWSSYVARNSGDLLTSELQLNLLNARRAAGEGEAVVAELQSMVDANTAPFPQDVVLGELAETLTQLDRTDEAEVLYERILEEYAQSAYSTEARRRTGAVQ